MIVQPSSFDDHVVALRVLADPSRSSSNAHGVVVPVALPSTTLRWDVTERTVGGCTYYLDAAAASRGNT